MSSTTNPTTHTDTCIDQPREMDTSGNDPGSRSTSNGSDTNSGASNNSVTNIGNTTGNSNKTLTGPSLSGVTIGGHRSTAFGLGGQSSPPVSVVPVPPQANPLLSGLALQQTLLAPRLLGPMIPTVSPVVTLATSNIASSSTQGHLTQGQGRSVPGHSPVVMVTPQTTKPSTTTTTTTPAPDGEVVLDVECGPNKAKIYLSKLCQGSKGPCVLYNQAWLTPNEFQYVSGRETAKDWKRSIRHHGKSMKLLMAKGVMTLNPPSCRCEACTGIDPFANNNLPLQESLTANTSTSALKTQLPVTGSSPPKVKVATTGNTSPAAMKKKPKGLCVDMTDSAGAAASGLKAVQADVNANTLGPVTSSPTTDCYEFRDSPVQQVCALPPILHPIPRGIPSTGMTIGGLKSNDSEKENSEATSSTRSTLSAPGGPTLPAFPLRAAHAPSSPASEKPASQQPAFPAATAESGGSEKSGSFVSNGVVGQDEDSEVRSSPHEVQAAKMSTSIHLSPGKIGQVDSPRDSKENQSKVFAPITWPPVVLGNIPAQGQSPRSHQKTSPKNTPVPIPSSSASSAASTFPSNPASTPQKSPPASSTLSTAVVSPSLAKPTPTVLGVPTAGGVPTTVPPVTISSAAVPVGYHEYMTSMMARYNMMAQSARVDEVNYMTMVRKYYADWYDMCSRYPYAALSTGAVYPTAASGGEALKAAVPSVPGMMPFPGYMYPMATPDPRLVDLSNRAAATAAAIKEAEGKLTSPNSGLKRSLNDTSSGGQCHTSDVLDLSVKKPRVESPVASRPPTTAIPTYHSSNPLLTHSIPGLVASPSAAIPGHPAGVPAVGRSPGGLTIPSMAGLPPTSTLQSFAAAGYPAGMLDPRTALALTTGNGTSAMLNLAHAQQQALSLSSVGYPMATGFIQPGVPYPQLCATSSDREKLLKAQHVQLAGDIRM